MDEELHEMDDLFQNAIERHSELPADDVWEHLERSLQKRKVTSVTKKYKKWKSLAAILFIFSVGLVIYTLQLSWKYKKVVKDNPPNIHNANSRNSSSYRMDSLNQKASNRSIEGKTKLIEKNKEDKKLIAESEETFDKNKDLPNIHPGDGFAGGETDKHKAVVAFKPKVSHTSQAAGNFSNQHLHISTSKPVTEPRITPQHKEAVSAPKNSTANSPVSKNTDLESSLIQEALTLLITKPSVIPFADLDHTSLIHNSTAKSTVRLQAKSLHPEKYTVGFFYSENKVNNELRANHPDFREDNYLQIKNHEKNKISTIMGLTLARKIVGNLSITSGIGLASYITDITRKPLVARKDNSGKINYRISTSSGYAYYSVKARPQPPIADSIQTLSSKSTVKYVTLPFGLQYNFYMGRFDITPSVLVNANFKSLGKIETIQSLEHTYISNIEGLKSHYYDGYLGLGIGYYLHKRVVLSLIPSVRLALSTATQTNPVTTHRNSAGLGARLGFSF